MTWSWATATKRVALGGAFFLAAGAAVQDASAQTEPAPSPPPAGTDTAPAPGSEPPPPLADSPMLENQGSNPPPPTYPEEPPPPPPEPAPEPEEPPSRSDAGPFSRGSVRLSVLLGTGSSVTDTYLILGAGIGYYILDGFEVGLDYEAWILAEPVLNRLSPETRYVFHMVPVLKPYVGVFYRHTFVGEGIEDLDHVGGRLGAYIMPRMSRTYVGGGAVYERLLDCDDGSFYDCDEVYPEISIGISF
jgi:hypothetical protein